MATITDKCDTCGTEVTLNIPDDHDGTRIAWECIAPTGPEGAMCGGRNYTEGLDPAELALSTPTAPEGAVAIGDGDAGQAAVEIK